MLGLSSYRAVKMDIGSSLLAILLLAVLGCVDAWGTVRYFNVSNERVQAGDTIVFRCGVTLEKTEEAHSLVVHIKKWFPAHKEGWVLTTNEDVERPSPRYDADIEPNKTSSDYGPVTEVEFTILQAELGDSGNYTCYTSRNEMTAFVDVISEPNIAELRLNNSLVGRWEIRGEQRSINIKMGEQAIVKLNEHYTVECVVKGGNPPPDVVLSSGATPYEETSIRTTSRRDSTHAMSIPRHDVTATLNWQASVQNIAQPLFDCVDKISLAEGENDLKVTCRVISMVSQLTSVSVRVYIGTEKNFTIESDTRDMITETETAYPHDNRYVLKVKPIPQVRICEC